MIKISNPLLLEDGIYLFLKKVKKLENRKYLRNNQIGEITNFFFFDGIESYNKFEDENEKYGRSYKVFIMSIGILKCRYLK
jgi:hypothetical protein